VDLLSFLDEERASWEVIYPPQELIFNAFSHTPFDKVAVVVLWQDPYHGHGQAMGLSFSVPEDVKIPPSLRNIYKEIISSKNLWDTSQEHERYTSGDLTRWADQWVLLLNSILTVRAEEPASHRKKGWETFTDSVISLLSQEREWLIFLLRGNYSKSKKSLIDISKHHVLEAVHPSPLSASRWWFGSNHFEKTNELLSQAWQKIIEW
jgi:uracil-DNA glycosylase